MRAVVIKSPTIAVECEILDEMFRLRKRVFLDRLHWNVSISAGLERDEFDLLGPSYILLLGDDGRVVGTARLMPADGPTMLQNVCPFLLTDGRLEAHARMVESSRFCVDTQMPGASRGLLHEATLCLFAAIIEWSICHGYDEIVTATDLRFERLLRHAGWPMRRLGVPHMIDQVESIAGTLPADRESFERVRPAGYASLAAFNSSMVYRQAKSAATIQGIRSA